MLVAWGEAANLGAAGRAEQGLLADALLEPPAHRCMSEATQATDARDSGSQSLGLIKRYLHGASNPLSQQLAAVLAVTLPFESLHRELLYRFDQLRALGWQRPVPLRDIGIDREAVGLTHL